MTAGTAPPPQKAGRDSRRIRHARRVIRWSVILLSAALLLYGAYRALNRHAEYRPGEDVDGITRGLEKPENVPASGLYFTDVTHKAGLAAFVAFAGHRTSQLPEDMGGGAAWGDFDNDGDDDLFVVSGGGPLNAAETDLARSMLFENLGDGRFAPSERFPELRIRGMGAAWADFDNDGWLDLIVTGYDTILLFRNRQGNFERSAAIRSLPGFWTGASWGDFNRDGWPDLYVCGYVKYRFEPDQATRQSQQFGQAVPYTLNPSSYEPERNLFFQNDGRGGFREVARTLRVDNPAGRSLSGLWHDFDDDGWLDLYVANDISESKLFLNRSGKFIDAGSSAWVAEYRGSMGLAAGDFDRDGDDDLFISHWIAQQFALYESLLTQQSLLKEPGDTSKAELHFTDAAEIRGVGQPTLRSIGWGAEFADFDSDGWPDLAVAAGSTFESATSPRTLIGMPSFLFRNLNGERFEPLNDPSSPILAAKVSRGLAVSDYDQDGDVDIAIVDLDGGVRLLRNDCRQGHALRLKLQGAAAQPWSGADGAQVTAWLGQTPLRRTVSSSSYLSQSSRMVHIGMGDVERADRVTVRWPSGKSEEFGPLSSGTVWQLAPAQPPVALPAGMSGRDRQIAFWDKHRAAMDKLKRDQDPRAAAQLFREALALDSRHEDGRYYLATSLAALGDVPGAVRELEALLAVNPSSHRAMQWLAYLHARSAGNKAGIQRAAQEAERAHALNPEETGALQLLGEIELLRGNHAKARIHLESVVRSNQRAALAHFLLAFLDSRQGNQASVRAHLDAAIKARGPEWKPKGSVHEGDVQRRMHEETSLFGGVADSWDGKAAPHKVFESIRAAIRTYAGQ